MQSDSTKAMGRICDAWQAKAARRNLLAATGLVASQQSDRESFDSGTILQIYADFRPF
jgi:hypothetical protein